MKIRVLSDLHLEYKPWTYQRLDEDVVVLAGDICDLSRQGFNRRDTLLRSIEVPVVLVQGNHEYYSEFCTRQQAWELHNERLVKHKHVHVLNPGQVTIDGIRFIGSTLWTEMAMCSDIERLRAVVETAITDFKYMLAGPDDILRTGPRTLRLTTWQDMVNWFMKEVDYLQRTIKESNVPTVVVTHFMPSEQSVAERFKGQLLNGYFGSNVTNLMYPPVKLWIHGHTHDACDYQLTHTRVVCNPRGYPREGGLYGYDSMKVVEV